MIRMGECDMHNGLIRSPQTVSECLDGIEFRIKTSVHMYIDILSLSSHNSDRVFPDKNSTIENKIEWILIELPSNIRSVYNGIKIIKEYPEMLLSLKALRETTKNPVSFEEAWIIYNKTVGDIDYHDVRVCCELFLIIKSV